MANPERYDQNASASFRASRASRDKEPGVSTRREVNIHKPVFEVKSGDTTIEYTGLPSTAEDALKKGTGHLTVYVHNLRRGHKHLLMSRRQVMGLGTRTAYETMAQKAAMEFRQLIKGLEW